MSNHWTNLKKKREIDKSARDWLRVNGAPQYLPLYDPFGHFGNIPDDIDYDFDDPEDEEDQT